MRVAHRSLSIPPLRKPHLARFDRPAAALVLAALVPGLAAQSTRLSGPLVPGGDVQGFLVSAGGSRIVYRADQDQDQVPELYSVPRDGSAAPVKLNPPLDPNIIVDGTFLPSDDGERVVFTLSGLLGAGAVHAAPVDGSFASLPLYTDSPTTRVGELWSVTPGGSVLFTVADSTRGYVRDLFSASLDGSGRVTRVNLPLASPDPAAAGHSGVTGVYPHPDGERVVYTVSGMLSNNRTYLAPADGSGGVEMIHDKTLSPFFRILEDRLVYHDLIGTNRIHSRLLVPGAPLVLVTPGMIPGLEFLPDLRERHLLVSSADGLFTADLDGSNGPRRITPWPSRPPREFLVSPGGTTLVFLLEGSASGTRQLYALPWLEGSGVRHRRSERAPVELSAGLPPGVTVWEDSIGGSVSFQISTDGQRVVFKSTAGSLHELYSVPIDGSTPPVKLNGPFVPGGGVVTFLSGSGGAAQLLPRISSDGRRLVYAAEGDTDAVIELYEVPIDGSRAPTRVNGPMAATGDALDALGRLVYELTPDDAAVMYIADQDTDGVHELYASELPALP